MFSREKFIKERNEALFSLDEKKIKRYLKKYGITIPREVNFDKGKRGRKNLDPDNPDNAQMVRSCPTKGKHILNPIIDWENEDIWEFIYQNQIPYCDLYDKGYTRLGCIGCPMNSKQAEELEKYPKFKRAYLKAFEKMLVELDRTTWKTPEEVMEWWMSK